MQDLYNEAFEDGRKIELEACIKVCEACEDTGDSTGIERDVMTWNKAVAYVVRRLKEKQS